VAVTGVLAGRITTGALNAVASGLAALPPWLGVRRTVISSGIDTPVGASAGVVDTWAPIRLVG